MTPVSKLPGNESDKTSNIATYLGATLTGTLYDCGGQNSIVRIATLYMDWAV
jgi:hypothetical protein